MNEQHPDVTPLVATDMALATQAKIEHEKQLAQAEPEKPTVETDAEGEITVIARNQAEMVQANTDLILHFEGVIKKYQKEKEEHEANFKLAKKRKIKSDAYQLLATKTQRKISFFEKIIEALKLGYTIVPAMDIDLFAIRTTRKTPKSGFGESKSEKDAYRYKPTVPSQVTNNPPAGEGKFVSPNGPFREGTREYRDEKTGKQMVSVTRWTDEFEEEIDFPFKLAKPAILNVTAKALAEKVFDELGVLPRRRGLDPMVVGRINYVPYGGARWQAKSVCFLVTWYIDTKEFNLG